MRSATSATTHSCRRSRRTQISRSPATRTRRSRELTEETEDYRSEAYGPLKALCEDVVRARFPDAFIPRPGLIGGPWDPTGRFTYWPQRFAAGGQVLAPTPADGDTQVIDARDLAHWIVEAAETGLGGTYNAVGAVTPRQELLETCRAVTGVESEIVWVDAGFLVEHGVEQWMELPMWLHEPEYAAMQSTPRESAARGRPANPAARRDRTRHARVGAERRGAHGSPCGARSRKGATGT